MNRNGLYEIFSRVYEELLFEPGTNGFSFANWPGVRVKPKDVIEEASGFGIDFPHELVRFVEKRSRKDNGAETIKQTHDDTIRGLRLYYESDYDIKIQVHGNSQRLLLWIV